MGDKTGFTRENAGLDYRLLGMIYVCLISYYSDTSQAGGREEFTATNHLRQESSSPSQTAEARLLLSEKCFLAEQENS